MGSNLYFTHGTKNEQYLLEDLIIESIKIYGQTFYYMPRKLVGMDEILGEDRLSQFKDAYPIDMYLETPDGFEGQGAFIQKFGLMIEQSTTLTVSRRTWEKTVGKHGDLMLPNRPSEGDLLWFPLTNALFEIKFVDHQDPFYQLRKLYVYKLHVELFQYSSERIDTGVKQIDDFETLKTFDIEKQPNIDLPNGYGNNNEFKNEANDIMFDISDPFGDIGHPVYDMDSTILRMDSSTITSDKV